jgi:hypothetical protein
MRVSRHDCVAGGRLVVGRLFKFANHFNVIVFVLFATVCRCFVVRSACLSSMTQSSSACDCGMSSIDIGASSLSRCANTRVLCRRELNITTTCTENMRAHTFHTHLSIAAVMSCH